MHGSSSNLSFTTQWNQKKEPTHATQVIPAQGRFQGHLQKKMGPRNQDQAATKIEIKFQSHLSSAAKRMNFLKYSDLPKYQCELQRWKQSYRLNGINDITSKRRGHPPKRKIPSHITKLIELYRKQYRWGSEVIQAHLLHDHSIQINRYLIDRFLHESGLKKQYPCTTSKKLKTKKKKHTKKVVVQPRGTYSNGR